MPIFKLLHKKILPKSIIDCLLLLVQKVFIKSYPAEWNKQILHAVTKKDHTYNKPDLRGIAIAPLLCRVYDNIIENRLSNWYKPNYQQAGFRKGQGCLLQIFVLTLLIHYSKNNKKNLFVAFMDYEKAFDYANRMNIISDLMVKGCGSQLTKAIANMYMVTEYLPRLKSNKLGESIKTKYGVTQGRKSSSTIFSFYVSDMAKSLDNIVTFDFMDPFNLAQLADDTSILSETFESLRCKIKGVFSYSKRRYQVPNIGKTRYCNFNENPVVYPMSIDESNLVHSVDSVKGYKYLGILFFPTSDINEIISKNINRRMVNVSKYYAWLEVNVETPVDIKLLVLDQCMFTALLYGVETWGDIYKIEDKLRKIEIDALRRVLKVKTGTSIDLIYFELNRADVISRIKDAQFKFYKKLSSIKYDEAVVKHIISMCADDDMIKYYNDLHGHYQEDNLSARKDRVLNSEASMIVYYRSIISPTKSCIYNSFLQDYFRFVITRWRLSNHKLKVETGRYTKPFTPRTRRLCDHCNLLEDEYHAVFICPKFAAVRTKYTNLLQKNYNIQLFLNPAINDVKATALMLHDIDKIINNGK